MVEAQTVTEVDREDIERTRYGLKKPVDEGVALLSDLIGWHMLCCAHSFLHRPDDNTGSGCPPPYKVRTSLTLRKNPK